MPTTKHLVAHKYIKAIGQTNDLIATNSCIQTYNLVGIIKPATTILPLLRIQYEIAVQNVNTHPDITNWYQISIVVPARFLLFACLINYHRNN